MEQADETHVWSLPVTPAPELPENVIVISTAMRDYPHAYPFFVEAQRPGRAG